MIWPFSKYSKEISRLKAEKENLLNLNKDLQKRVDIISARVIEKSENPEPITSRNKLPIEDIAQMVKDSVANLNRIDRTRESTEDTDYIVEDFEVEIKGGVTVDNRLQFTELTSNELGPQSVSTLKFKVRPITKTRISE
jgi:hypothetical protein